MTTEKVKRISLYVFCISFSLINLVPLLWMIMNAFKSEQDYAVNPFGLPKEWVWGNFKTAWESAGLTQFFINSMIVTIIATVVTVILGALASYFITRFDFKILKWVKALFLLGMLIPIHATLVPVFLMMNEVGLSNSRIALIFPYIAFNLPITIFILSGFMSTIPKDIEESATIDGCSIFRVFRSIILPITLPSVATVTILNFIYNWNEFLFALVLINDSALKTLPLGLTSFVGVETASYTLQMAALTLALIPTIVVYLFMEKQLVNGMSAGAVKG
ncbi:putative ABC transporter permease protein YurM [Bacillus sp. J14TS2]|uniref:carbohydrate ABC transporter permease n=1 Tax=Bacillus sp. J14TS2 TaxID=2807188 RepID=UPI001B0A1BA6|nr:carbohydrate ABC transporter permease [Bacillus sp. J14TS2]GIN71581.1 putative ABC transporter permease protein YurM [Bacillus sp. J14TS2]